MCALTAARLGAGARTAPSAHVCEDPWAGAWTGGGWRGGGWTTHSRHHGRDCGASPAYRFWDPLLDGAVERPTRSPHVASLALRLEAASSSRSWFCARGGSWCSRGGSWCALIGGESPDWIPVGRGSLDWNGWGRSLWTRAGLRVCPCGWAVLDWAAAWLRDCTLGWGSLQIGWGSLDWEGAWLNG